jgi:hypothetical protein
VASHSRFVSHEELEQMLRRAGYSKQQIDDVLRDFPDPIDTERDAVALTRRGLTLGNLTDRRGGSP